MNLIEKISFQILYIIAYLFSLLPMSWLYALANVIRFILFKLLDYRRDTVIANIARSFPLFKYKDIKNTANTFYQNFANYWVEIIKSISAPLSFYRNKVEFLNFESAISMVKDGKTVLAGMGHITNWEILNILPAIIDIPTKAVYKTQSSKGMDMLMQKVRSRFGMQLITSTDVAKHLLSKQNTNALYIFIADQAPMHGKEEDKLIFLNQSSLMFNGLEKIGVKVGAEIVYLHMYMKSRGHYVVTCHYLGNAANMKEHGTITKAFTQQLEDNIKEQPSSWLWSHKRWKR